MKLFVNLLFLLLFLPENGKNFTNITIFLLVFVFREVTSVSVRTEPTTVSFDR